MIPISMRRPIAASSRIRLFNAYFAGGFCPPEGSGTVT